MAKKISVKENLKGIKVDELKKRLILLRENLRVLRFKAEGSKAKNVKEGQALRKQIARTLTEINRSKK